MNIFKLTIQKPTYIAINSKQKSAYAGDELDLNIKFSDLIEIKFKIDIVKDIKMSRTVLILPNENKSLKTITAQAALLGYEGCYQYNEEQIKMVVCLEKM